MCKTHMHTDAVIHHINKVNQREVFMNRHEAPWWRKFRAVVLAGMAASLVGCGGGSGGSGDPAPAPESNDLAARVHAEQVAAAQDELEGQPASAPLVLPHTMSERAAVRFLNQATFGATDVEKSSVQERWRAGWLEQQFAMPPSRSHWDGVQADAAALLASDPSLSKSNLPAQLLDWEVWQSYLSAPDQLRKRVGYALSQILVVSMEGLSGGGSTRALLAAGYLDVLEKNAFGNYRDLLRDVSLSPAMGLYLSHRGNKRAEYPNNDPTQPPLRVPDENYAREVMQLFSIGLYELNMDGTLRQSPSSGGAPTGPIETYTQADIEGLARVFTGWDWVAKTDPDYLRKPMVNNPKWFSPEPKQFLKTTIPGTDSAQLALDQALDTLFKHPNTAPFISKQLIQRLVTSNPSQAYVKRVASVFADNGQGVRGDLRAVVEAVLRDDEAIRSSHIHRATPDWGKLREPVLRLTGMARAFGVSNAGEIWRIGDLSDPATALGQSPMRSPTVFNFYRPGYVPPGTVLAAQGLVAPEFQITTDTSVPGYVNFIQTVLAKPPGDLSLDFSAELALVDKPLELVDRLNLRLANSALGETSRQRILDTLAKLPAPTTDAARLLHVRSAIVLTMAAPEYLIQK